MNSSGTFQRVRMMGDDMDTNCHLELDIWTFGNTGLKFGINDIIIILRLLFSKNHYKAMI